VTEVVVAGARLVAVSLARVVGGTTAVVLEVVEGVVAPAVGVVSASSLTSQLPAQRIGVAAMHRTPAVTSTIGGVSAMHRPVARIESVNDESDAPSMRSQFNQLAYMFRFTRPYRTRLIIGTVAVVISAGLGLVFPAIMGRLVDAVAPGSDGDVGNLDRFGVILLVVLIVQALFNYLRVYQLGVVGEGVVADLRMVVFDRVVRLPVPFFDRNLTGDISSRLTSDAAAVQHTVSTTFAQALSQSITLIGGVVLLVAISPVLSLTVLTFLPIVIIAAAFFGRKLRRLSMGFQDKIAEANSLAHESISSIRVVKWFSAEEPITTAYDRDIVASYNTAVRRVRLQAVFVPAVTFVGFSTVALVLWVGGRLVADGSLTAGELVSFLLYTLTVAGAIAAFTGLYSQLQATLGASHRIFELLGEEIEGGGGVPTAQDAPTRGAITFESVDFAYQSRETEVLHEVDLKIAAGEVVALVGPSGAGKSTLVQLIPRFYDVQSGRVLVDGVDVKDYSVASLRSVMAAVPQEVQLFSGSIAENLRIAQPGATDEELVHACRSANADRFVTEFPDGYDTVVGERGVQLSGGQRQRIAIARALLADPKILVLDEATSSLDAESEGLVQEALERLMVGRTTLVIAHRLSTVRDADRLIVVAEGRVVEQGTHDKLVADNGMYARLYAKQLAV
jgi:subfamily B ATP-binding cassette protein MsbA